VCDVCNAGEVFRLRKLLPATADYDFNIHIMDFSPGQFLTIKVLYRQCMVSGACLCQCRSCHRKEGIAGLLLVDEFDAMLCPL
jgi:hypothetical protein